MWGQNAARAYLDPGLHPFLLSASSKRIKTALRVCGLQFLLLFASLLLEALACLLLADCVTAHSSAEAHTAERVFAAVNLLVHTFGL